MSRAFFWPVSTEIVSNNLAIGAEQLRDRYFFCVWQGRRIFCESPPGVGLWGFYWGRYSETGVWRLLRYTQSFGDLIGYVRKIHGLDFEVLWLGNFVGWINISLDCLGKNTRDILRQKRKKIRKKGTRKLLIGVKDREWAIDLIEKESKKKRKKQIKDWKNVHAKPVTVGKSLKKKQKKKRKEEPENVLEKRQKKGKKKKMKDNTNTYFQRLLSLELIHVLFFFVVFFFIFYWICFTANFVDQFDKMKSGTLV